LPRAVATKNLVRDGSHGLLIAYKVAYQFDFISLRQRVRDVERLRVRSAKFAPARRNHRQVVRDVVRAIDRLLVLR